MLTKLEMGLNNVTAHLMDSADDIGVRSPSYEQVKTGIRNQVWYIVLAAIRNRVEPLVVNPIEAQIEDGF